MRANLRNALNLPYFAEAILNGSPVSEDHLLRGGDRLEFLQRFGFKGNRGIPAEVLKARGLLRSYPELLRIGTEVKALGLDTEEAVDLALAFVARFLGDRFGPIPESENGTLHRVVEALTRIEDRMDALTQQRAAKDSYSTEEVARIVGRSDYTVREWCRYGRLRAVKRKCGRGRSAEWSIPHGELVRYQNEGLLPM